MPFTTKELLYIFGDEAVFLDLGFSPQEIWPLVPRLGSPFSLPGDPPSPELALLINFAFKPETQFDIFMDAKSGIAGGTPDLKSISKLLQTCERDELRRHANYCHCQHFFAMYSSAPDKVLAILLMIRKRMQRKSSQRKRLKLFIRNHQQIENSYGKVEPINCCSESEIMEAYNQSFPEDKVTLAGVMRAWAEMVQAEKTWGARLPEKFDGQYSIKERRNGEYQCPDLSWLGSYDTFSKKR